MNETKQGADAHAAFARRNEERKADNAAAAREEAERDNEENDIFSRFFYHKPKLYYFKEKNQFSPQDKESLKRRLQSFVAESDIGDVLLEIESRNYIPVVYQMQPGRRAGVMESKGVRYIVLNDYYFPYPTGEQGACDIIIKVITSFFGDEQAAYFLAWVKGARYRIKQCLETGDYTTACQIMCIVGAHDLGKTNVL